MTIQDPTALVSVVETDVSAAATTIRVLPESGHHFQFVPFTQDQLGRFTDLERLCSEGKSPWNEGCGKDGKRLAWLRYRFCSREIDGESKHGLLISIETNLGRCQRGWVYSTKEALSQAESHSRSKEDIIGSPYAFKDDTELPAETAQKITLKTHDSRLQLPAAIDMPEVPLLIIWQKPLAEVLDVDLVIDFGNTRTVALLLEHNASANGILSSICCPVRFVPRGNNFSPFERKEDPAAIVDSWFVLQEPMFSNLEPNDNSINGNRSILIEELHWETVKTGIWPFSKQTNNCSRTVRVPQMFVEFSPAVMGAEASNILTQLPLELGGNFFLSSPKRYLWDEDILGHLASSGLTHWTMDLNRWNPDFEHYERRHIFPKLQGTVLRFLDEDGRDWSLESDSPPNERQEIGSRPSSAPKAPAYPRADTLTWTALGIIETAYRQMMSTAWRESLGTAFVPRRLQTIVVTFPPGWTGQELAAYRRKWQKAVDIFTLAHLSDRRLVTNGGNRPILSMEIDEAVASQLPIVFGEIQRLGAEGENWIELVGRGRGPEAKVRILNIDIGGGTTDVSIIEYCDELPGPGVKLKAEQLYRDSSTIAGDAMVRQIIETVLLPQIGDSLTSDEMRNGFERLLSSQKQAQKPIWSKITRLVFIPIVRWWLRSMTIGSENTNNFAPSKMIGSDGPMVDAACVKQFNSLCLKAGLPGNLLSYDSPLKYDRNTLCLCVRETFSEVFRSLAKVVESFQCDLALVSGKPSELSIVKELLENYLPVLPQRIMFAQSADVGEWYPLSTEGKVHDAKTVTVAGAALYQAIKKGLIPGWTLDVVISPHLLQRNYWGQMPTGAKKDFSRIILKADEDSKWCEIMIPTRIGRRMLPADVRPEPVYQLRWRDRQKKENAILEVEFQRVLPTDFGHPEYLEIRSVRPKVGQSTVQLEELELRLCTLDTDDYWMDSGTFDVIWNEVK